MGIIKFIVQFVIWCGYVFFSIHAIIENWVQVLDTQGADFILFMLNTFVTIFFVGLGWALYESFFGELKDAH